MQNLKISLVAGLLGVTLLAQAQVLVHDTWTDGTRTDQNLPTESAWFASSAATLSAITGSMIGADYSSSVMWLTYFTDVSPASLNIGESLIASLRFTPGTVTLNPGSTTRGLRIGLYDFSGGTRVAADTFSTGTGTGAPGAGVRGYMLNMNFAQTFTIDNPLQLLERTTVSSINLMGATGDYTSFGSGPSGVLNQTAFANNTTYNLTFRVTRSGPDSVNINTTITGGAVNISHSASDLAGATFSFDSLAIRVGSPTQAAASFRFPELQVQMVPEPAAGVLMALGFVAFRVRRRWQ